MTETESRRRRPARHPERGDDSSHQTVLGVAALEKLRRRLSSDADVFDEPGDYLAGVEDTLRALCHLLGSEAASGPSPACASRDGNHTRLDSRQASNALMTTIAYPSNGTGGTPC